MKHLDSNEEMHLKDILTRLNTYYTKRNTDILINFRDFDRNNIGKSQQLKGTELNLQGSPDGLKTTCGTDQKSVHDSLRREKKDGPEIQ